MLIVQKMNDKVDENIKRENATCNKVYNFLLFSFPRLLCQYLQKT
jgi:hypothetical protein